MSNTNPQERTYTIDEAACRLNQDAAIHIDIRNDGLISEIIQRSASVNCVYDLGDLDVTFGYIWKNGDLVRDSDINTLDLPTIKLSQIESTQSNQNSEIIANPRNIDNAVEREEEKVEVKCFRCKCGYETVNSLSWCNHADCCSYEAPLESIKGEDVEEAVREKAEEIFDHNFPIRSMIEMAQWQRQQSESRIKELEEALKAMRHEIKTKGSDTDLYCVGQLRIINVVADILSKNK